MTAATAHTAPGIGGIHIQMTSAKASEIDSAFLRIMNWLSELDLAPHVETTSVGRALQFRLDEAVAANWTPGHDTLQLQHTLAGDASAIHNADPLEREIVAAMLVAPRPLAFASADELFSAVRIRHNIAQAAAKTALAFNTRAAERPEDYWRYDKDHGFLLQPDQCLIAALQKATQPDLSGKLYDFSCYRATEYVILLGLAQELRSCNPALFEQLQNHCRVHAIRSGKFHDVFLIEYGSMDEPLPPCYYVPGDRLWFRNPDEHSSDATGYEGSWVMYLGGGLFTNFWKQGQPYTMTDKCLEIYHWRHGAYTDAAGELQINEAVVEERVAATRRDPEQVAHILSRMLRLRDPKGVYQDGGCIDSSREYPRGVQPGTSDIVLPALD